MKLIKKYQNPSNKLNKYNIDYYPGEDFTDDMFSQDNLNIYKNGKMRVVKSGTNETLGYINTIHKANRPDKHMYVDWTDNNGNKKTEWINATGLFAPLKTNEADMNNPDSGQQLDEVVVTGDATVGKLMDENPELTGSQAREISARFHYDNELLPMPDGTWKRRNEMSPFQLNMWNKWMDNNRLQYTRGLGNYATYSGGQLQPISSGYYNAPYQNIPEKTPAQRYAEDLSKSPAKNLDYLFAGMMAAGTAPFLAAEAGPALAAWWGTSPTAAALRISAKNPYVQGAITSLFAAEGANDIINHGALSDFGSSWRDFYRDPNWYTGLNATGQSFRTGLDALSLYPAGAGLFKLSKEGYEGVWNLAAKTGNNTARAKVLSREMNKALKAPPPIQIGEYSKAPYYDVRPQGREIVQQNGQAMRNSSRILNARGIEGNIPQEINISPEELNKILQEQEGYYFFGHGTGRTGVDPEVIFNSGLRVRDGDVRNTAIPISESNLSAWPHLNSEEVIILPGRADMSKYDAQFGHIPTDWYDTSTFIWDDNPGFIGRGFNAVQKPNASFTEKTVEGIPGVYTKPEAVLGSYNTRTHTLRLNPNSQYKFPFLKSRILDTKGIGEANPQTAVRRTGHASLSDPNNPFQIRLTRLNNKFIGDYDPSTQKMVNKVIVRDQDIRKAFKELDPSLSEDELDLATQTAFASRRGVHVPIGDNSGRTTGGVSVVDIKETLKYLRESGIINPNADDVGTVVAHEAGHGVKVNKFARDLVRDFRNPDEFYTLVGQVLDDAKVTKNEEIPFGTLMRLTDKYLKKKKLDNGITEVRDYLSKYPEDKRKDLMKAIARFSGIAYGLYLVNTNKKNGKVQL